MGRTNIVIDDHLIAQAMELTGTRSKRQAVDLALRSLVDKRSAQQALRKLKGKLPWQGDVGSWRRGRG